MLGAVAWVALSACSKGKDGIKEVTYADGDIPGVGVVSWSTRHAGKAHVEYGLDADHLDLRTPEVDAAAGKVTVLGLEVATEHFIKVVVEDGDERWESAPIDPPPRVQPPPKDTPALQFGTWNPDLACDDGAAGGYVLFNYLGERGGIAESGVAIVDRKGKYVWSVRSDSPDVQLARTRLGRDGHSILWNTNDYNRVEDIAHIERISIDGSTSSSTRTLNGHHDFVELPSGELAWIAYEFADPPLELSEEFPDSWDTHPTAYERIYQAPEGITDADTPTLVFDQLRDWPDGFYYNHRRESGAEACGDGVGFLQGRCEVGHGNSLAYIDSVDQFQLGFRWLDATLRVAPTGAVQWVFGGPLNEFAGNTADLPVHFHYSDVWADGMMVFDNHDPDPSRAMEYSLDTAAMTFSTPWSMQLDKNEGLLGDVRRIPLEGCENVLVALSQQGILEEVTPDNQVVWRVFYGAAGDGIGRVQYLSSLYDFTDQANWQ